MAILLRESEVLEELSIGRTLLYRLLADGKIESVKVGRRRLYPRAGLVRFVEQLQAEQVEGER